MVILVDDEDRENEGDLVIAAEKTTPQAINFMATHARGLICVALPAERVDRIGLPQMTRTNRAPLGTAFTDSVDAARGIGQGISARDRAHTILTLMGEGCGPGDLRTPGHVFPLRAREGGVLVRPGQTEGSVDLSRLAGLDPGAVICEIMKPDGSMARLDDLLAFGAEHGVKVVTVADLIAYRLRHESFIRRVADVALPTEHGPFRAIAFENALDSAVHLALVMGEVRADEPTLVRVHRADLISDVFGLTEDRRDGRLQWCLRRIAEEGRGVVLYLRSGNPDEDAMASHTLSRHIKSDRARESSTARMSFQDFGLGAQILHSVGLRKIRVITNNPYPFAGLSGFGLEIVDWLQPPEPSGGELEGDDDVRGAGVSG